MPNIKSSAKRDQLAKARYAKNKANKSALRTTIKKFNTAVAEGDKDAAVSTYKVAVKAIDTINLALASQAYAFIKRRGYVIPEDIRALAYDVLRHRIGLTYEAEAENITTTDIISAVLNTVEVP